MYLLPSSQYMYISAALACLMLISLGLAVLDFITGNAECQTKVRVASCGMWPNQAFGKSYETQRCWWWYGCEFPRGMSGKDTRATRRGYVRWSQMRGRNAEIHAFPSRVGCATFARHARRDIQGPGNMPQSFRPIYALLAVLAIERGSAYSLPAAASRAPSFAASRSASPRLFITDILTEPRVAGTALLPEPVIQEPSKDDEMDGPVWPWQLALLGTCAGLEPQSPSCRSALLLSPVHRVTDLAWFAAGITACWGANLGTTTYALEALGDPSKAAVFVAARFVVGAGVLVPFVASATSAEAVFAGIQVGALCALGYAAQSLALAMGTAPGTAAFICSLQSVVVALMSARSKGVAPTLWLAVLLSVSGVGFLELGGAADAAASAAASAPAFCLGDLVAFGQPLSFGLSYVVLEQAMAEHPEDELPLAALQCMVIAVAAVGAASLSGHQAPLELPWGDLLPGAAPNGPAWAVPAAVLYTGLVSTALTIWLQAKVFKRVPSTDASIILASEPLWATAVALVLLGGTVENNELVGGFLIVCALACNSGAFDGLLPASLRSSADAAESDPPRD